MRSLRLRTLMSAGLISVATLVLAADGPPLHTDRAHWFQLSVPDGWQVSSEGKGSNLAEVSTLKDQASPGARITLQIRQLSQLPELITRDQLLKQAHAILKAVQPHQPTFPIAEITGWPMTGVTAEYSESSGTHTRLTVLIDVPRQRAFIWKATAPVAIFPRYDLVFDQVVAGLVPALPEN